MKMIKNILNALLISLVCLCAAVTHADVSIVYYHNDALGSPVAATDENGDVLWREDYAPYGEKLGDEMEAVTEKVGYTGHRYDSDTGLTYAGARMYDPSLGRFMGIDPVGALEGVSQLNNPAMFNRYAYANNNPYKYVDPDGEFAIAALVVAAIFVIDTAISAGQVNEPGDDSINQVAPDAGLGFLGKGLKGLKLFSKADVVENTDKVKVRHHTSAEGAKGIKSDGAINPGRGNPNGVHVEVAPFGPTKSASAETGAFGKGKFVEFEVSKSSIKPTNVGPRNTGVIPTEKPLNVKKPKIKNQ